MQKFKNPVCCYFREQSAAVTAIYFCCISKYVRINTVFLKYECHLQSLSLKRIQCIPVGVKLQRTDWREAQHPTAENKQGLWTEGRLTLDSV